MKRRPFLASKAVIFDFNFTGPQILVAKLLVPSKSIILLYHVGGWKVMKRLTHEKIDLPKSTFQILFNLFLITYGENRDGHLAPLNCMLDNL